MELRAVAVLAFCAMSAASLMASATVVASAEGASPSPGPAVDESSVRRDLYTDMPYYLGSYEPDIVITRGAEHITDLAADDETRLQLEAFIAGLGADIEDMDSGYALVSTDDVFGFVVAIRVHGAEPGTLLPGYLPILLDDLVDPSTTASTSAGKDVVLISSLGDDDQRVVLIAYDQGDTLWLLHGPDDIVEATLESLPDPA